MSLIVLRGAGPLGMITSPKSSPENNTCRNWVMSLTYNGFWLPRGLAQGTTLRLLGAQVSQ